MSKHSRYSDITLIESGIMDAISLTSSHFTVCCGPYVLVFNRRNNEQFCFYLNDKLAFKALVLNEIKVFALSIEGDLFSSRLKNESRSLIKLGMGKLVKDFTITASGRIAILFRDGEFAIYSDKNFLESVVACQVSARGEQIRILGQNRFLILGKSYLEIFEVWENEKTSLFVNETDVFLPTDIAVHKNKIAISDHVLGILLISLSLGNETNYELVQILSNECIHLVEFINPEQLIGHDELGLFVLDFEKELVYRPDSPSIDLHNPVIRAFNFGGKVLLQQRSSLIQVFESEMEEVFTTGGYIYSSNLWAENLVLATENGVKFFRKGVQVEPPFTIPDEFSNITILEALYFEDFLFLASSDTFWLLRKGVHNLGIKVLEREFEGEPFCVEYMSEIKKIYFGHGLLIDIISFTDEWFVEDINCVSTSSYPFKIKVFRRTIYIITRDGGLFYSHKTDLSELVKMPRINFALDLIIDDVGGNLVINTGNSFLVFHYSETDFKILGKLEHRGGVGFGDAYGGKIVFWAERSINIGVIEKSGVYTPYQAIPFSPLVKGIHIDEDFVYLYSKYGLSLFLIE